MSANGSALHPVGKRETGRKVEWEKYGSGIPRALTAVVFSLYTASVSAHRKPTEVSGLRWMTTHLPSRLGTSGWEGDQPTISAESTEFWHAALQVRKPNISLLSSFPHVLFSSLTPRPNSALQHQGGRGHILALTNPQNIFLYLHILFPLPEMPFPLPSICISGDLLLILPKSARIPLILWNLLQIIQQRKPPSLCSGSQCSAYYIVPSWRSRTTTGLSLEPRNPAQCRTQ